VSSRPPTDLVVGRKERVVFLSRRREDNKERKDHQTTPRRTLSM